MNQLDPKAVWLFFINFILRWFMLVIFLSIWALVFLGVFSNPFRATLNNVNDLNNGKEFFFSLLNWFWIIIPAFLILCFIWARLTYHFYRYELTDVGFRKELGVIYKKYVTIPYNRIQNVDIYRGILARILGLSDINIQTAGMSTPVARSSGGGAEGRLPALSQETAEQLRNELIQRAHQSSNQGL